MNFNKILLGSLILFTDAVNGTEVTLVDGYKAEKGRCAQIQDALTVLPPIQQYIAKMKDVEKRYEIVFESLSTQEEELRIKVAKQKAKQFYCYIFGVAPSEIKKYNEKFTTEQYLAWVTQEIIDNGDYTFADNIENLFDAGLAKQADIDFSQKSSDTYPESNAIPELYQIYAHYNDPFFEEIIVHETGHVLEYAYRVLKNIRNETRDTNNHYMCEDSVSAFFETLYSAYKNDSAISRFRLSDLYSIKFKQTFSEKLKQHGEEERENNYERYKEIEIKSKNVSRYQPWERYNDHKNMVLSEDERTKNDSEENFRKYISTKYPEVNFVYKLWENQMEEWGTTTLPTKAKISSVESVSWSLSHFLNVYLGKSTLDLEDIRHDYVKYPPHVYRTLKLEKLNPGKDVVKALDHIVRNVPPIMTKGELKEFIELLKINTD